MNIKLLKQKNILVRYFKDNPKTIILISSFDGESQCGGGGTTIPKNCVTNITYLQKPKRLRDRI